VDDWRKHRWGYYRMIEKVDAEIGKSPRRASRHWLGRNTLIVFTARPRRMRRRARLQTKRPFSTRSRRACPLIVACGGKTVGGITEKLVNTGVDSCPQCLISQA